nr:MAG TPA: thioredoxin [Caudoviricetes sp.]
MRLLVYYSSITCNYCQQLFLLFMQLFLFYIFKTVANMRLLYYNQSIERSVYYDHRRKNKRKKN